MTAIAWLRKTAGQLVANNRRGRLVGLLHRCAAWVERHYHNENMDLATNGELGLLRKLQTGNFRVVIDAGANVGDWSLVAARLWPSCRIHAFEIVPQTFSDLQKNVAQSPCRNITPVSLGLGSEAGTMRIHYYPDHPDISSDSPRHPYRSVEVDAAVVTLDSYCAGAGITAIDFLKIDVEGAEYRVLQGARTLLEAGRVHCIQFEYGAFSTDTGFLLKHYYEMLGARYWIGKIHPGYVDFRDYDWHMEDFRFCNYLCVSRQRADLRDQLAA